MSRPLSAAQFEDLYRATAKDVFAYVRRRVIEDAEEVVAETYAIAWKRRSNMPAAPYRRAWLFGIARRLLLAEHRRQQRERIAASGAARAVEERTSPVDGESGLAGASTSLSSEPRQAAVLAAAIERLPAMQREVLRLTAWECLSPGELAVALGIKTGAARVRLHRARQTLAADPEVRALVAERHLIINR